MKCIFLLCFTVLFSGCVNCKSELKNYALKVSAGKTIIDGETTQTSNFAGASATFNFDVVRR